MQRCPSRRLQRRLTRMERGYPLCSRDNSPPPRIKRRAACLPFARRCVESCKRSRQSADRCFLLAAKEELEANFDAIDRVFPRHGEEKGERLVARWLGVCARSKYVTQLRTGKEFGRGQKGASSDTFSEAPNSMSISSFQHACSLDLEGGLRPPRD